MCFNGKGEERSGCMKIAEVSKEYGLSADTLRYYERIGLLPNVTRTPRDREGVGEGKSVG